MKSIIGLRRTLTARISGSEVAGPSGVYSSRTIEDGSFLRLKTLQLRYTLPKKFTRKLRLQTVQVYLTGQNL